MKNFFAAVDTAAKAKLIGVAGTAALALAGLVLVNHMSKPVKNTESK